MTQELPPNKSTRAVFLSYASEDAAAAQRICAGLRGAGLEVWLDQSELRGGDAWDEAIRQQIKQCTLFIPVLSRATWEREEGYFRLEWKLAVDRSYLIMSGRPFLLPVAIDDTEQDAGHVPERFRELQWTRLPGGHPTPEFVSRVARLMTQRPEAQRGDMAVPDPGRSASAKAGHPLPSAPAASLETPGRPPAAMSEIGGQGPTSPSRAPSGARRGILAAVGLGVLVAAAAAYWALHRSPQAASDPDRVPAPAVPDTTAAAYGGEPSAGGAFHPAAHSIAVLPFVNLSGDEKQEYFSDGLAEEILNSLAEIEGLQVAARMSSFSFKGRETDLGVIARKLNVATILEGSVRRSTHTVRVTAQLIDTVSGFNLWSKSFDREIGDVLKLQADIAKAVAGAMKITLLGNVEDKIELGMTRNAAAMDAFLRGRQTSNLTASRDSLRNAQEDFSEAIRLDPGFAMAYAERANVYNSLAAEYAGGSELDAALKAARADADQAIALVPELAQAHQSLANVFDVQNQFAAASAAYARAVALGPGNARILAGSGRFDVFMGRSQQGLAKLRHAVTLDPLNASNLVGLGNGYLYSRHYPEALRTFDTAIRTSPLLSEPREARGFTYYLMGDLNAARASCETNPEYWGNRWCLVIVYDKLGRDADSDALLANIQSTMGDAEAYQYATIYAQRGNTVRALEWLEKSLKLNDPGLEYLKTDPLMDPLRNEPRFRAVLAALKFPD